MKPQELRKLAPKELQDKLEEAHKELFNLRFRLATRQLTQTSELRKVKKRIAQIKTLIREKELGIAPEQG